MTRISPGDERREMPLVEKAIARDLTVRETLKVCGLNPFRSSAMTPYIESCRGEGAGAGKHAQAEVQQRKHTKDRRRSLNTCTLTCDCERSGVRSRLTGIRLDTLLDIVMLVGYEDLGGGVVLTVTKMKFGKEGQEGMMGAWRERES